MDHVRLLPFTEFDSSGEGKLSRKDSTLSIVKKAMDRVSQKRSSKGKVATLLPSLAQGKIPNRVAAALPSLAEGKNKAVALPPLGEEQVRKVEDLANLFD